MLRDTWIETETFIMGFFLHANVKASGRGLMGRPSALAPTVHVSYLYSKQNAESKVSKHTEIISRERRDSSFLRSAGFHDDQAARR